MDRHYYQLNESDARTAHEANSFSEFNMESEVAMYRASVDSIYELADAKAEKMPDYAEDAYGLADKYAKSLAEWLNKGYRIDAMCPSLMVCGGGNFPVNRKNRQNAARDRHMKEYERIRGIKHLIRALGTGGIQSGDPKAIEKLESKLAKLEERQDLMKRANAYWRKHKTLDGMEGISDEAREDIEEYMGRLNLSQPFATFELSNNRAKIKSARERIERLRSEKEAPKQNRRTTVNGEECEVVENAEIMRLQLVFDDRPGDGTREVLKRHGFRWSPKNGAWQRQLTDNARRALSGIEG